MVVTIQVLFCLDLQLLRPPLILLNLNLPKVDGLARCTHEQRVPTKPRPSCQAEGICDASPWLPC